MYSVSIPFQKQSLVGTNDAVAEGPATPRALPSSEREYVHFAPSSQVLGAKGDVNEPVAARANTVMETHIHSFQEIAPVNNLEQNSEVKERKRRPSLPEKTRRSIDGAASHAVHTPKTHEKEEGKSVHSHRSKELHIPSYEELHSHKTQVENTEGKERKRRLSLKEKNYSTRRSFDGIASHALQTTKTHEKREGENAHSPRSTSPMASRKEMNENQKLPREGSLVKKSREKKTQDSKENMVVASNQEVNGQIAQVVLPGQQAASPAFTIETIDPANYPQARKTILAWKTVAKRKLSTAKEENDIKQFKSASEVGVSFAKHLQTAIKTPAQSVALYACKHNGKTLGMILTSEETTRLKIEWLLTDPENIRSPQNRSESAIPGVGIALATHAEKKAQESGKSEVFLSSAGSSKGFYINKLGYKDGDLWDKTLLRKAISKTNT